MPSVPTMPEPTQDAGRSCRSGGLAAFLRPAPLILAGAFAVILYILFVAILSIWVGLSSGLSWRTDLRFVGLLPSPYDNVFIRALVWLAFVVMFNMAAMLRRKDSCGVARRVRDSLVKACVFYVMMFALHLAWMAFVHLVGGETSLTLSWRLTDAFEDYVPLRAAGMVVWLVVASELDAIKPSDAAEADSDGPLGTLNALLIGFAVVGVVLVLLCTVLAQFVGSWVWVVVVPMVLFIPMFFAKVPRGGTRV